MKRRVTILIFTVFMAVTLWGAVDCASPSAVEAGVSPPTIELTYVTVTFAGKKVAALDFLFRIDNPNETEIVLSQMLYELKVQGASCGGDPAIAGSLYIPGKSSLTISKTALVTHKALMFPFVMIKGYGFKEAGEEAGKILNSIAKYPFNITLAVNATFTIGEEEKYLSFNFEKEITKPE